MQSKPKRAPLLSRLFFAGGAFLLGATFLISEGALRLGDFTPQSWSEKAIVWCVGLLLSMGSFAVGSRVAQGEYEKPRERYSLRSDPRREEP